MNIPQHPILRRIRNNRTNIPGIHIKLDDIMQLNEFQISKQKDKQFKPRRGSAYQEKQISQFKLQHLEHAQSFQNMNKNLTSSIKSFHGLQQSFTNKKFNYNMRKEAINSQFHQFQQQQSSKVMKVKEYINQIYQQTTKKDKIYPRFNATKEKISKLKQQFQRQLNSQAKIDKSYNRTPQSIDNSDRLAMKKLKIISKTGHHRDNSNSNHLNINYIRNSFDKNSSIYQQIPSYALQPNNFRTPAKVLKTSNTMQRYNNYLENQSYSLQKSQHSNSNLVSMNAPNNNNNKRKRSIVSLTSYVPQIFRYCIACQSHILENNINFHEESCLQLQQLYRMDLIDIKYAISEKIVNNLSILEKLNLNSYPNWQKHKNDINQFISLLNQNQNINPQYYDKLLQIESNYKVFKSLQIVKKIDWFLRVKKRVQQGLYAEEFKVLL